ncbi:MAG TPA: lytic transglycosylase domain-containing protein [Thermoanaerobaculia bacterium]|nr:lytic transglycosylase domain-containing protein [Thermoanaerobaculia bacterium]
MSSSIRPRPTKHPRARRSLVPPAILLLVPILLGSSATRPIRPNPALPLGSQADRSALLYAEAADAARRDDCAGAARSLSPLTSGKGAEAEFARLVNGFHAYACKQAGAEERLFAAKDPDGPLEDWRLYALSDTAHARSHVLLAQASLAKLLGDYPESPLRPKAYAAAAQLAWEQGDSAQALELIEHARREKVSGAEGTRLEALAWEIGTRLNNELVLREAARRLLADSPSKAAELKVAEMFRAPDGNLPWGTILSPDQIKQRARALLDLKLDASAGEVLDAAPGRDLEWALLKAEVLTRLQQGADALVLLSGRNGANSKETAELEWARAQAADEASKARRGRNTPTADRRRYLEESHLHLRNVAKVGDAEIATKALRSLYADLADDERFEESIEVLRQLRKISPADTTGAEHLWKRGWSEYVRGNASGAVGYWTELFALYPEDSNGRRGRYWTGRAFEALGETERAQQIYREVAAADTTDFYRKNALTRLRGQAPATDERGEEPWPEDPVLQRARLLTDLGLEDLAAAELEVLSDQADERAVQALQALIEARQGERRKSVLTIRKAFPALGTPYQATLPEEARRLYYPLEFQDTIRTWAVRNRLPLHLVLGIIRQESAFDTRAQSWAGARGLMQLMPATARELAGKAGLDYTHEKLSDPSFNVRLGTTYFSQVMDMFDHNVELSLAGYNGGPYRIKRLWKESGGRELDRFLENLDLEESKTYVKRILVLSDSYRQLYPMPG